jgi:hypothetical protein
MYKDVYVKKGEGNPYVKLALRHVQCKYEETKGVCKKKTCRYKHENKESLAVVHQADNLKKKHKSKR